MASILPSERRSPGSNPGPLTITILSSKYQDATSTGGYVSESLAEIAISKCLQGLHCIRSTRSQVRVLPLQPNKSYRSVAQLARARKNSLSTLVAEHPRFSVKARMGAMGIKTHLSNGRPLSLEDICQWTYPQDAPAIVWIYKLDYSVGGVIGCARYSDKCGSEDSSIVIRSYRDIVTQWITQYSGVGEW